MFSAKTITAALAGSMMTLMSVLPAEAITLSAPKLPEASQVQEVQYTYRQRHRDREHNRDWSRQRHGNYHGYDGYRDRRAGYRRHSDGYWYPLAAFGAGAIIGGAIASQNRAPVASYNGSRRHVQWCMDRYRSYDASSNTYVPRAGYRAQCVSPYSG